MTLNSWIAKMHLPYLLLSLPVLISIALPGQQQTALPLERCSCNDLPRLKDREQKLEGVQKLVSDKLQAAFAMGPANQAEWTALQNDIHSYLQALQIQNLTLFPDVTLFNGNNDPFCDAAPASAGECLDQVFAIHQQGHASSCASHIWSWQAPWSSSAMLQEELSALQTENDAIKTRIKQLNSSCQLPSITGSATQQSCPQFIVVVQVVTTSAIAVPGLNEQSGRSLNNGQGIPVPLIFKPDNSFEGTGSGTDSGSAAGATPGETVRSQFGHTQSVAASGTIEPGSCATQPCRPDVMHLVLDGGPSQQMTTGQARGSVNRNVQQTTPTGAAHMLFDLPAYIGGNAQRQLLATGIVNSNMTVSLVQGQNGSPALPDGSSLRYSLSQCKK